jgi:hypothetical protein
MHGMNPIEVSDLNGGVTAVGFIGDKRSKGGVASGKCLMKTKAVYMRIDALPGSVLLLAGLFSLLRPDFAMAQDAGASERRQAEQALVDKTGDKPLVPPRDQRTKTERWIPPEVDRVIPEVAPGSACPLTDVLAKAGKRIQELIGNVDRFTATEVVEHQSVDHSGQLRRPEVRNFRYLVSIAQMPNGHMNVDEYRNGGSNADQFPDHIATVGTPSLVLIFHPRYAKNFSMTCEGLGQWKGQRAWQVRFEERADNRNPINVLVIGGRAFALRLRGRAWILANSYQVARLESDLADEIPEMRLRRQHQDIEYRPVHFEGGKIEIWLPSTSEIYMDFRGHQFYRRHRFTDFQLFSVQVQQTVDDFKE